MAWVPKIGLACLLPLVMLTGCFAPEKTIPEKVAPPKHMFWKISDENSSVHILGSFHFADSSFYPLDTSIMNAYNRSGELAVELDVMHPSVIQQMTKMADELGKLKPGQSLVQFLPEDVKNSLDSLCKVWLAELDPLSDSWRESWLVTQEDIDQLYGYKPWVAAMQLSSFAIMKLDFSQEYGIDFYFIRKANESQKKVISLETVDDHVAVLVGKDIPDLVGVYYLRSTISETQLLDSSIKQMMRAWKAGDDSLFREAMYMEPEGLAKDSLLEAEIEDRLYFARNRIMADSIASFLAQDRNVFIVLGTAHMAGRGDNVLELLKQKGLAVEQR